MQTHHIYVYIFFISKFAEELIVEFKDYYWGGVIEAFISCEQQWIDANDLWPFGMEQYAKRISVVQVAENFNPVDSLLKILASNNVEPRFIQNTNDSENNMLAFDPTFTLSIFNNSILPKSNYGKRFLKILTKNLDLSKKAGATIFMVGGKGFSLDLELEKVDQQLLKKVGMMFPSRMP
jgi:hypothetical protein